MAEVVTEAGYTVGRQQVIAERPVKALGFHDFRVRLHPEVEVTVTANVARSAEEAETQARLGRALVGMDEEEETDALDEAPDAAELLEPEALEAIAAEETAKSEAEAESGDEEETTDTGDDASESGEEKSEEEKSE